MRILGLQNRASGCAEFSKRLIRWFAKDKFYEFFNF